jgi:hypothetical protein
VVVQNTFQPFTLPEPEQDETASDYRERLRALGWTGVLTVNPDTTTYPIGSPAAELDPEAVTRVQVGATTANAYDTVSGADVWPDNPPSITATDAAIVVQAIPGTRSGPCGSCAIDWTPIESIDYGAKFPFGVFGYINGVFGSVDSTPSCPTVSFNRPTAIGGGVQDISLCSASWETTYRPIVFPIIEFFITIAAVTFLARRMTNLSQGGDEE